MTRTRPGRYGSSFVATFRPAAHWSPEIRRHDGLRCGWKRVYIVEEGPFAGQWACVPVNAGPGLAWAPESELVERE